MNSVASLVPSRRSIKDALKKNPAGLKFKAIAESLGISRQKHYNLLRKYLRTMCLNNQITYRDKKYQLIEGMTRLDEEGLKIKLDQNITVDEAIKKAIVDFAIPNEWPQDVISQLRWMSDETIDEDEDVIDRVDLTSLAFVTMDGEDAKDFDDAVYCEELADGKFKLYVAIADVSHYVRSYTAVDKEAQKRGNSVYFPGFVIPMLPEVLSNDLCSLKPNVSRLCMVCEMNIGKEGGLENYKFYTATIKSAARLTYAEVNKMLEDCDKELLKNYAKLVPYIKKLRALYELLYKRREERGALDIDIVETKIILNEYKQIAKIVPDERGVSHKIIEECMLLANVCAAKLLAKAPIGGVYRIHPGAKEDSLVDLARYLTIMGVLQHPLPNVPTAADFNEVIKLATNKSEKNIIQMAILRSMAKAEYSPKNIGHFGLAYAAYTHFTSPIRRYADLMVHRILKIIISAYDTNSKGYDKDELYRICEHVSTTERQADDATREVVKILKCGFMYKYLGHEFAGVISGVLEKGFFVTLNDMYVDGFVRVSHLRDDYYELDESEQALIGNRTRKKYKLGDKVAVQVVCVDMERQRIDFDLVE